MPVKIVRNDIVRMDTEAIVNTANERVTVGRGCDRAVYMAAGYEKLLNYRRDRIGHVEVGEAFITPGFDLPAKYIIHAVAPKYLDGNHDEEMKLRSCYRRSLRLASEHDIHSLAFPLISTGSFGYPKEIGLRIALDEIYDFLFDHEMDIYIVVFDKQAVKLSRKLDPHLRSYIDAHYVAEKLQSEYDEVSDGDTYRNRQLLCLRMESVSNEEMRVCSTAESSVFREDLDSEEAIAALKRKLDERQARLADSFSDYLMYLIQQKGLTNVEVYKNAIIDKKLFAKIKNDADYHPQKQTCLCLCVGAKLNMDETRDLLARAGYALSPSDMRDVIFSFFIENGIYDMVELDIQLEEYGLTPIIK